MLFETAWDRRQLAACAPRWSGEIEVAFSAPSDAECPESLDPLAFVAGAVRGEWGRIDGVMSSGDFAGVPLAGAIAAQLGLPGSRPERLIAAGHKYHSRIVQREVAAEAVPGFARFAAVRDAPVPLAFPCFVKPVKGSFSVLARPIEDEAAFRAFLASPAVAGFDASYLPFFHRVVKGYAEFPADPRIFLAEELLRGDLVTVEGYVCGGRVELLGIVDSTLHANRSFARFDYPSALPAPVQQRMAAIARRVVAAFRLDQTLWNIEMMYDAAADRVAIVEVNPRLCGQFADLYQKVDGTNSYEIALALCTGETPRIERGGGRYAAAASFPLRVFEPSAVESAPYADAIAAAEREFAETCVWSECSTGDELRDFEGEDGASQRYAVINLGGDSRDELAARCAAVAQRLGFRLRALR